MFKKIRLCAPRIAPLFFLVFFSFLSSACTLNEKSSCTVADHPEHTLSCYLAQNEVDHNLRLVSSSHNQGVNSSVYSFISQVWSPQENVKIPWQHRLTLHIPDALNRSQEALLMIGGGTNSLSRGSHKLAIDYAQLAQSIKAIVVLVEDVPNQSLVLDDGVARKEDDLLAYTLKKYLDNPESAFWPLHVPMVKSVTSAMDRTQEILLEKGYSINKFVLSGLSKRGWVAWLTATQDIRVSGLIPVVIDVLDTKNNFKHIHNTYQRWPQALNDYVKHGIDRYLERPVFDQLMQIVDPLTYLDKKAQRFEIPKYVVSASGDDFFPPDSNWFYWSRLPGPKVMRVVPNQAHTLSENVLSESIQMFYRLARNNWKMPQLSWTYSPMIAGQLDTLVIDQLTQKPRTVTLWRAVNQNKRDFRKNTEQGAGVIYQKTNLAPSDEACTTRCVYFISTPAQTSGWVASFVEVTIQIEGADVVLTMPVFITPKQYPGGGSAPFPV